MTKPLRARMTLDSLFGSLKIVTDQLEFKGQWDYLVSELFVEVKRLLNSDKSIQWRRADPSTRECWLTVDVSSDTYNILPGLLTQIALHLFWEESKKSWVLAAIDKEKGPRLLGNADSFVMKLAVDLFGRTCGD